MLHLSMLPHQLHALLHFQRCFAVAGGSGSGSSSSSSSSSVSICVLAQFTCVTGTKVQILTRLLVQKPVQLLGALLALGESLKYFCTIKESIFVLVKQGYRCSC